MKIEYRIGILSVTKSDIVDNISYFIYMPLNVQVYLSYYI